MATPDFSKVWASNSPLPEYTFSDADYVTGWDFVGSAPPTKNEFDAWFKLVDTKLNWLYNQMQQTASKLYPVGSVYISFNAADPSTLFGGTWQRLKDRFLLASGDTYAANTTGGSSTKTIAVSNMPAHNHSVNTAGAHTHSVSGTTGGAGSHSHSTGSAGTHTHKYITRTGSGTSGNVAEMQTSGGGYNGSMSSDGAHTHTVSTVGNHSHSFSATTGNNGAHTHTTNNTGGGLPLNIMPPYTTVYAWRRTA